MRACRAGACEVCQRRPHGHCVRCGGYACERDDLCAGCGRVICRACDVTPTPPHSYPGDKWVHPHSTTEGLGTFVEVDT
jgi:hypothetical protein